MYKKHVHSEEYYGIFAPPTRAQDGLDILINHFLGNDWYTLNPINQEQVNTEAIHLILKKYPKKHIFFKRYK